jgi:hypothetical protein
MSSPADPASNDILRTVLDAMPSAVLVVDGDVRIIDANRAAHDLIRLTGHTDQAPMRAGEALHCLHAFDHPEGCGRSAACADCVIRGAVQDAMAGQHSFRRRIRLQLHLEDRIQDAYFQVTVSGFCYQGRDLVLLVLEDISEFAELRKIVPICAQCKKIRQDEDYWQSVESYIGRFMDLSFSHSYCPSCKQEILRSIDGAHGASRPVPMPSGGR